MSYLFTWNSSVHHSKQERKKASATVLSLKMAKNLVGVVAAEDWRRVTVPFLPSYSQLIFLLQYSWSLPGIFSNSVLSIIESLHPFVFLWKVWSSVYVEYWSGVLRIEDWDISANSSDMGKKMMGVSKMLECFSTSSSGCFCTNSIDEDEIDQLPLMVIDNNGGQKNRFGDVVVEKQTLAFQLKPKVHSYIWIIWSTPLALSYMYVECVNVRVTKSSHWRL